MQSWSGLKKKVQKMDIDIDAADKRKGARIGLMKGHESTSELQRTLAKLDSEDAAFLNEEAPPLLWVHECRLWGCGLWGRIFFLLQHHKCNSSFVFTHSLYRELFGRKLKEHVHGDRPWDAYTTIKVMQGFMPEIFASYFADKFHAKEFLGGILRVMSARNSRAHGRIVFESDSLDAMQQMCQTLEQCSPDNSHTTAPFFKEAAGMIQLHLERSKKLVARARKDEGTFLIRVDLDDYNKQQLYIALGDFELHLKNQTKGSVSYEEGTIAFGKLLQAPWNTAVVQPKVRANLKRIAHARHWYFHNLEEKLDIAGSLTAMEETSQILLEEGEKEWKRLEADPKATSIPSFAPIDVWKAPLLAPHPAPENKDPKVCVSIKLETPSNRMSVPITRCIGIVGRGSVVRDITSRLMSRECNTVAETSSEWWGPEQKTFSRVVLWGEAGMGKDTVGAEVIHQEIVQHTQGIQFWVQASSEVVLQRQLVRFFTTHRPNVIHGVENDVTACLAKIKVWLHTTSENWLIVFEDASANSKTVWDILRQPEIKNRGRVLITSQAPLHNEEKNRDYDFEGYKLEAITTKDSLNLLMKGNLFRKKPAGEAYPILDDAALEQKYIDTGVEFMAPASNEKPKDSIQRQRDMSRGIKEMSRPELTVFLKKELGNLPLSVSMIAQLIRSDPKITSTLDLIEIFKRITMQDAWVKARNRLNDTHLFGLTVSVQITLDRMDNNEDYTLQDRWEAKALLCALSRLDRTKVPLSLLIGHEMKNLVSLSNRECPDQALGLSVFGGIDTSALTRARDLLFAVGLLHRSPTLEHVGVIHQLVQKCVREVLSSKPETAAFLEAVRCILRDRFHPEQCDHTSTWPGLRDLLPSVTSWCKLARQEAANPGVITSEKSSACDIELFSTVGLVHHVVNGDVQSCLAVWTDANFWAGKALPEHHHLRIDELPTLRASLLENLGRHEEAVELLEDMLWMRRSVLLEGDPRIADVMSSLATSYLSTGRTEEVVKLVNNALEIYKRAQHQRGMAQSMLQLGSALWKLGDHEEALIYKTEALDLEKSFLDEDDPTIATSMHEVATSLKSLGRLEEALAMDEEGLALRKRVLLEKDPQIAVSISHMADGLALLGRHEKALPLWEEALAIRERALPKEHPKVALSMQNLARSFVCLERHKEALTLFEKMLSLADYVSSKGNSLVSLGQHEKALPLEVEALALRKHALPKDHPDIAKCVCEVAERLTTLGRFEEALAFRRDHSDIVNFTDDIKNLEKFQEFNHSDSMFMVTTKGAVEARQHEHTRFVKTVLLATRLQNQGDAPVPFPVNAWNAPSVAAPVTELTQVIQALQDQLNLDTTLTPETRKKLKLKLKKKKQIARARRNDSKIAESSLLEQKETRAVLKQALPKYYPHIAKSLMNVETMKEMLAHEKRVLSHDDPKIATSMAQLALLYSSKKQHTEALALQKEALAFRKRVLPKDHPDIGNSMSDLASSLQWLGQHKQALELQEKTLAFRKRVLPLDDPDIAKSMHNLASVLGSLGQHQKALALQKEMLTFRKRTLPDGHHDTVTSMACIALSLVSLGRPKEALVFQEEVLVLRKQAGLKDNTIIAMSMNNMAITLLILRRHRPAEALLEEALAIFMHAGFSQSHPHTVAVNSWLQLAKNKDGFNSQIGTRMRPLPKLQSLCSCGSGAKYKNCCY
jgi:tetratricopeptide (TPR) repeat protein